MKTFTLACLTHALLLAVGFAVTLQLMPAHADDELGLPEYQLSSPSKGMAKVLYERTLECWPSNHRWNAEIGIEARVGQRAGAWFDSSGYISNVSPSTVSLIAHLPLYSATELDREHDREAQRRRRVADAVGQLVTQVNERVHVIQQLGLMKMLESRAHKRVLAGIIDTSEQVNFMTQVANLDGRLMQLNGQIEKSKLDLVGICLPNLAPEYEQFLSQQLKP
jgi:hypothetical protein